MHPSKDSTENQPKRTYYKSTCSAGTPTLGSCILMLPLATWTAWSYILIGVFMEVRSGLISIVGEEVMRGNHTLS